MAVLFLEGGQQQGVVPPQLGVAASVREPVPLEQVKVDLGDVRASVVQLDPRLRLAGAVLHAGHGHLLVSDVHHAGVTWTRK